MEHMLFSWMSVLLETKEVEIILCWYDKIFLILIQFSQTLSRVWWLSKERDIGEGWIESLGLADAD